MADEIIPSANPWEYRGRQAKAEKLAIFLHSQGHAARFARNWQDAVWEHFASLINVKKPSAETQAMTVKLLQEMEQKAEKHA